jgi:hypothetical protein
MLRIQMIIGTVSVLLLGIVLELIRRGRLREKYALLWLLSGVVIAVFSIFPGLLSVISKVMGVYYLTALFVISFLFLLLIVLHFSTVLSWLSDKNKELTQELSILDFKFKELDKRLHELTIERG